LDKSSEPETFQAPQACSTPSDEILSLKDGGNCLYLCAYFLYEPTLFKVPSKALSVGRTKSGDGTIPIWLIRQTETSNSSRLPVMLNSITSYTCMFPLMRLEIIVKQNLAVS
jgi:hypothetical protein